MGRHTCGCMGWVLHVSSHSRTSPILGHQNVIKVGAFPGAYAQTAQDWCLRSLIKPNESVTDPSPLPCKSSNCFAVGGLDALSHKRLQRHSCGCLWPTNVSCRRQVTVTVLKLHMYAFKPSLAPALFILVLPFCL